MTKENQTGIWLWVVLTATLLFCCFNIYGAKVETPTIDEFIYVPSGCAHLVHNRFDLANNPPLMKYLMALPLLVKGGVTIPEVNVTPFDWGPWIYGYQFMLKNQQDYFNLFFYSRLMIVLIGFLTGVLLFIWLNQLYGIKAAAIVTSLFYLSPTILAHSHLATNDIGCMFSFLLVLFVLRWAYQNPTLIKILWVGLALGIALLIKYTAVLLLPIILVLIAFHQKKRIDKLFLDLFLIFSMALLTINLGMGFKESFKPVNEYHFISQFCQKIAHLLPEQTPIPLPKDYMVGFDVHKVFTEKGEFNSYLNGRWSKGGDWSYLAIALVLKTPFPFLILLLLSFYFLFRSKLNKRELLFLLFPPLFLLLFMLCFNRYGIGVRHILPLFPFFFLLIGSIWKESETKVKKGLAVTVLIWYFVIAFVYFPSYLSFFNTAIGGEKKGHNYLVDSNLDWGQDLYRLKPALDKLGHKGEIALLYFGHVHPGMYGIEYRLVPSYPIKGLIAVSTHFLMGGTYLATAQDHEMVMIRKGHLNWLKNKKPIARIGSIWIFDTRQPS